MVSRMHPTICLCFCRCKPSSVIAAWESPRAIRRYHSSDSANAGAEERIWLPMRFPTDILCQGHLISHMVTLHQERTLSRSARLLALLQALRCRRRPVTAAAVARELHVSERTIYRDLSELAARGAAVRPGLFLPPLMLTEDETEAVLLGLRYVDQRGDDVLTKAAANAHAKSWRSYRKKGRLSRLCRWLFPTQRPKVFQRIRCRLARSGQRFECVGGLRSATPDPCG
jgi:HTH domain